MKRQKIDPFQLVRVTWIDSSFKQGWTHSTQGVPKTPIVTIGYVTHCDDERITIASTVATDKAVLNPLALPWGTIQNLEVLGKDEN